MYKFSVLLQKPFQWVILYSLLLTTLLISVLFGTSDSISAQATGWSESIPVADNGGIQYPSAAIDSNGDVQLIWFNVTYAPNGLYYTKLSFDGTKLVQNRQLVSAEQGQQYSRLQRSLVVDSDDNVHVVWIRDNGALHYMKLDNNGNILVPVSILNTGSAMDRAVAPSIAIDGNDNLHITYKATSNPIHHLTLNTSGEVLSRELVASTGSTPGMGVGSDGSISFAWLNGNSLHFKRLDINGNILVNDRIIGGSIAGGAETAPTALVDTNLNTHVLWGRQYSNGSLQVFYTKVDLAGNTLVNEKMVIGSVAEDIVWFFDAAIDAGNNLHLVWSENPIPSGTLTATPVFPTNEIYYVMLDSNAEEIPGTYIRLTDGSSHANTPRIAVRSNRLVVVWEDDVTGVYYKSTSLVNLNQAPSVDAGGAYLVAEGGSVPLTATGIDPENAPLTFAWDLDNNGSFETPGQSVTFSALGIDGPSMQTVIVKATDNSDLSAIDQGTINIANIAPTAIFTNTSNTVIEGESATLVFSNQFDPSGADTAAGFLYSYDCTNDGTFEDSDISATSFSCQYTTSGNFTVLGIIKDKDGDVTSYTVTVIVLTSQQAIQNINNDVQQLVTSGVLTQQQGNSLQNDLDKALKELIKGKIDKAIQALQSFIAQVNGLISTGVLTSAQGQPLIDAANEVIVALTG